MLHAIGASAKGTRTKKDQNEDAFRINRRGILVADGVGSCKDAWRASIRAVDAGSVELERLSVCPSQWRVLRALREVNAQVALANDDAHTTLSAVLFPSLEDPRGKFWGISVGDSRIYRLHRTRNLLRQISIDDVVDAAMFSGQFRGRLTASIGWPSPALGTHPIFEGKLPVGECLLVCSDGFWRNLNRSIFRLWDLSTLRSSQEQWEAMQNLVDEAAQATTDDATAVLVYRTP